jgi:hypothetical protein
MAILETLSSDDANLASFYDADMIAVGEGFARLSTFLAGDASLDTFRCDAGTLSSIKRAAARIVGLDYDKTTDVRWVQRSKDGRNIWVRLAQSATPKTNDKTKVTQVRSYSSAAVRSGVRQLRENHSVAIKRQATRDDGSVVVALVRTNDETQATEEN